MIRGLNQDLTRWTVTKDGFGAFTFGSPESLKGRWEGKREQFRNALGDIETSDAIVYLESDVLVGDYIFEGTSVIADPTTLSDAFPIKQFAKVPDLRNVRTLRKAFL